DEAQACAARTPAAYHLEIEASSVVAHRKRKPLARHGEPHPYGAGVGVPQHVVDRLLSNAEARRLGFGLYILRRLGGVEMRGEARDARLPIEMRAQRGGEPEIVELRRPQAERKLPHPLQGVLDGVHALGDSRPERGLGGSLQRLDLDFQRGQRLADIVVKIARQASALLFLDFEQASRQGAQPLMRVLELAVDPLQCLLRLQALRDVVDDDETGPAAAPADEMAHAVDVDRLAVLAHMAKNAAIDRATGLVAQEIAPLVRPPQVSSAHLEKFL